MSHHGIQHSSHVRLTSRGKVVLAVLWCLVAWVLASVLPFWWTKF